MDNGLPILLSLVEIGLPTRVTIIIRFLFFSGQIDIEFN